MNRGNLWRASLMMIALTAIACGQDLESTPEAGQPSTLATRQDAAFSQFKALILDRTVVGGTDSVEAAAARRLGLGVTVATDAQWAAMTAADFATYRVIILGDAHCASLDVASAALANRHVWGPVINGNMLVAGTAPVANGAPALVTEKAIRFASAESGLTGLYMSLSCYYENAAPNTHVELLEPFGTFSVQGGGCHNTTHIVSAHPALNALSDHTMSNWSCSVNAQFDSFPLANFAPWSIALYPEESRSSNPTREFVDGTFGAPYILARGTVLVGCGNYEEEVGEQCDYGNEGNGLPGSECSSTCQFNWCGNGVVDPGEDCDLGMDNGIGACPRSCRTLPAPPPPPPPANRPPVARCRSVLLSAGPACGGVGASINHDSSDPDGDLVGCVQSLTSFEVGSTLTTLTCTDAQGLSSSCTAPVTVVDDSAPMISCPAPSTFECGTSMTQLAAAQAQDNCVDPFVTYTLEGEGYSLGTPRTVSWLANDGTNEVTCSTSITMVDTLAPSLSLKGEALQQLECGVGSYNEVGALASDQCAGDLSSRVAISGSVNAAAVGSYPVAYSVVDGAGNEATAARTVRVSDTLAPSLALVGAQTVRLECGVDGFTNPGATAADACSGNLTSAIVYGGTVNEAAVGSYAVTYSVADRAGHSASAVRTVEVADTQAPAIALNGASMVSLECGVGSYSEEGATANDVCAGSLSNKVSISGTVNAAARGTYTKTYSVADTSGNVASAVRTVKVNDTLAPSLALVGASAMRLECGVDSFTNPGATAVDACSGNLTGAIVSLGAVNAAAVGSYPVSYSVVDGMGLAASAVRAVEVADTRAPAITLNGASAVTLECGVGSYSEAGATAMDACTGNVSSRVSISGTVNPAARGTYTKTYSVTDASGNAASASRTVNVADTRAPSISLVGSANMSINRGSTFVDPGATATDSCSGTLTSAIVKTGTVNTSVAGTYTLRYTVQDGAGLSAAVSRTVTVVGQTCNTTVNVKPTQLIWPPNHSYRTFRLSDCAAVTSSCGTGGSGGGCHGGDDDDANINTMGEILSIYSDEPEDVNGNGDGHTDDDIVITGPSTFKVRAERQGKGNGRFYGVRFQVTDSSGAVQTATCKFVVPHDQSGRGAIDNGAAAGYTVNAPNW